jgi:hypothetical protein
MREFHVSPLPPADARIAYPLVRAWAPEVTLVAWLRFVKRALRPGDGSSGIYVATPEGHRFPSGLFCYCRRRDLALGDVICADHFVAVDILDPGPVVDAMVLELEKLGARLVCTAVRSVVHGPEAALRDCLESRGHRQEAVNFLKRLA